MITLAGGILAFFWETSLNFNAIPYLMVSACMLTVGYLMAVLTIRLAPISVTSPDAITSSFSGLPAPI